ncbi:MAG TPA: hypothetical protein VKJ45_21550, partial [Blastocatellia bacterium]|nr:hypothetical protein [Blastocatellia bacterium]
TCLLRSRSVVISLTKGQPALERSRVKQTPSPSSRPEQKDMAFPEDLTPSWDRTHPACADFITNSIVLFDRPALLPGIEAAVRWRGGCVQGTLARMAKERGVS